MDEVKIADATAQLDHLITANMTFVNENLLNFLRNVQLQVNF